MDTRGHTLCDAVMKVDYDLHSRENKLETREFIPEIF